MKYSEFREYLKRNGISLKEYEEKLIADDQFEISKRVQCSMWISMNFIKYSYEYELIKKVIELAETPLSEREEEKKYYLKHRYINNWGDDTYLNYVEGNYIILTDKCQNPNYKTKFTKAEIEDLKEKFNTDLRDFEIIEVVED